MKGKIKNIVNHIAPVMLAALFAAVGVNAQTIDSTDALKLACETSPNNTVTIDYPAKISNGAPVELPEQVATPCTVVLAPSGSFETDQVGMNFAGAFAVQSSSQTQVKFVKSLFSASSVSLATSAAGSYIGVSESLLRTTAGDLSIATGFNGVLEIALPLSGSLNSLESSGAVTISGGSGKFEGSLLESQISAASGISVSLGGAEAIFKTDRSKLLTTNGAVTISSQGSKSLVELAFGEVRAANGVNVTLPGAEGNLVLQDMIVGAGVGSIAFDVARFGRVGKIGVFGSTLNTNAGVSILASISNQLGSAVVENSIVNASQNILVQTGRLGETIVKTNRMNSLTNIAFRTGLSGSCLAEQNALIAPIVRACR